MNKRKKKALKTARNNTVYEQLASEYLVKLKERKVVLSVSIKTSA